MQNLQISILGTGSMGGAILTGLLRSGHNPETIRVTSKSNESASSLHTQNRVQAIATESNPNANVEATKEADIVILGVKPAQILSVLEQIAPALKPGALVISVAAGITTTAMEKIVGNRAAVIRAMPNTPAVLGLGVTGLSKGQSASPEQLALATELFRTVGEVLVVEESQINALSTISGSGPAYLFYFAEKLIEAAKKLGFTQSEAELMVKATFLGSSKLLTESDQTSQQLRANVTSPGGTTMQAIARFDEADLEQVFIEATKSALARAVELGSLNS
ncbi:MAG: pyrroline-5-carboxylate reductase [Actinomycetota bacterium]